MKIQITGPKINATGEVDDRFLRVFYTAFVDRKPVLNGSVHYQQPCDHEVRFNGNVTVYVGHADAESLRQAVEG